MNDRDLDRILQALVDDGPTQVPDRIVEAALAQIPTTPQRGSVARPWRFAMIKPIAALLGAGAVVAFAVYFGLARPGDVGIVPSAPPDATPSPTSRIHTTTQFAVPLSIPLDAGFGVDLSLTETASSVTITAAGPYSDRLVILPLTGTDVVGGGGRVPITSTEALADALDGRAGVSAEVLAAFDTGRPASYPVGGVDAPVVDTEVSPEEASADGPILRTAAGETIDVEAEPWRLWILPVARPAGEGVVAIYSASSEDHGQWAATFLSILESLEFRN